MITEGDKILIQQVENFLIQKSEEHKDAKGNLWKWTLTVSLEKRLQELLEKLENLRWLIETTQDNDTVSVLDLGCGVCTYWPFFQARGCNRFVGIDLYRMRGQGEQAYQKTAIQVAEHFCSQSSCDILEGDVRDIDRLFSIYKVYVPEKFDIIFTKNTNYTKLGSTGIPREVFDDICDKWLKPNGIKAYVG
jgi:SAM-dependent methyltransferase